MQAISENKNTDDIFTILESAMALATESEEKLNGYFIELTQIAKKHLMELK